MIEVFNEINQRKIQGIMFHEAMADYFDFLNMNGLKCWQEFRFLEETYEMRKLHRFVISHCNKLIKTDNVTIEKYIPATWYNYTRMNVDTSTRKQAIKESFEKWYNWEKETIEFLEKQFKKLTDNNKIAEANEVNELICDTEKELKHLTRKMLEYKAVDYDISYIMQEQKEMCDYYKDKAKALYI